VGSDTVAAPRVPEPRVDRDLVSRFANCCRALGLSVHDRKRPADLTAARSGFAALTHVAHDQCDAWTGLAAAGDTSVRLSKPFGRHPEQSAAVGTFGAGRLAGWWALASRT
jgi:hypothetical protein